MKEWITGEEREILLQLIRDALEDRPSAIKDTVNQSRERLYVLFAKLSGKLEQSTTRSEEKASVESVRNWSEAGSRVASGS